MKRKAEAETLLISNPQGLIGVLFFQLYLKKNEVMAAGLMSTGHRCNDVNKGNYV